MSVGPTYHQGFQPFPNLDAPIANPDLTVSIPWYQLFLTLWNRTGGGNTNVNAVSVNTTTSGGAPQALVLGVSPNVFVAGTLGVLVVSRKYTLVPGSGTRTFERGGETLEVSRDGGTTWQLAGFAPTSLFLCAQDVARVSWFTSNPPIVKFYPVGA